MIEFAIIKFQRKALMMKAVIPLTPIPPFRGKYRAFAGNVALDFVNTLDWRSAEQPYEWLSSYDNFLVWARGVNLITASEADELAVLNLDDTKFLENATILREAIYRIVISLQLKQTIAQRDLSIVNHFLQAGFSGQRLLRSDQQVEWSWIKSSPEVILGKIAWEMAYLLMSNHTKWLGSCESCGCVFVDLTKNHTRRWCIMDACGNRIKVRKHRSRLAQENL
jgi:predicted RNA-binding Zn ribbon-like protein